MQIKQWLNENKEGIVYGGVVGTAMFFIYLKTNNANILIDVARNTSGLFDVFRNFPIFSGLPITTFLLVKVYLGFVAVGMIVGAILDMMLPERIL